ncbi:MAG TPA: ATP-binding protein [Thermoanaerobaculia bacterium]
MPEFVVPTNATLHAARSLIASAQYAFDDGSDEAVLLFHPGWVHAEPIALAMMAAWGMWCKRQGYSLRAENLGKHTAYAARMRLFQQLDIDFDPGVKEHEEAGRFLPLTQVRRQEDLSAVIVNISAILHLREDPESLAAVQYCISELLRNVLEHSNSPDGAFVCAQRFSAKGPHRVTIAVADCGQGITAHLAKAHPEVDDDDVASLGLAMQPGITGALSGTYGTPENAGAGLFITRCIAKGTGGYFLLSSGRAAYRLRRSKSSDDMVDLHVDPYDDERGDRWKFEKPWRGTLAVVEIRTETIADYDNFFQWIFKQIPSRTSITRRIKFT